MKIIHVSTAHGWRGGEQQCLYLARGLQRQGIEQLIVAQPDSPLHKRATDFTLQSKILKSRGEFDPKAIWTLRNLLVAEQADIVHAHDAHAVTLCGIAGWLTGKIKRVCTRRVDFALHGKWKYQLLTDKVICISKAIKKICQNAGIEEEKLVVVYSGIDPDRLRENSGKTNLRRELELDRRDNVIINVASLTDHKGHCYLLEAMLEVARGNPHARLLLVGEGELEANLQAQCRELALADKVKFLGFRNDLGALYNLADLFVMSSHLEGLCTSVLDAMACELAVVITDAGGLPETFGSQEVGLIVPAKDPQKLAVAISKLLDERKTREKMGIRGRKQVMNCFSVEQMVEGTKSVYLELVSTND